MAAALSQQKCSCLVQQASKNVQRPVVRPVPFSSASSSTSTSARNVQVYAKGKGASRRMAPGMAQPQMVQPRLPEVDPDNEEFCIFTRATTGAYQNWMFVSIVKGGSAANALVKAMESEWGKRLYSRTLISNIGQAVYKDRDAIVKGLKKSTQQNIQVAPGAKIMEPMINQPVTSFEFGFKIRDKTRPSDVYKAENLTIIPKEAELTQQPLDKFKAFFSPDNLSSLFGGSS